MASLEDFRLEVREWIDENLPASLKENPPNVARLGRRGMPDLDPDVRLWLERLVEKGWTVPIWPKEYGGADFDAAQNAVFQQEMRRANARTLVGGMGVTMIGPALVEFGTHEQKLEHLPKIVDGSITWCQGYSEPNAGSDLASLATRAVEDGDEYIINGQKIWTSGADQADWIFCLVRTDFEADKHNGITFILFDMESPGVTVRPIKLISGASQFCETFFEDVRASKRNVIGTVNQGWTVAKRLLQYERTMIGGGGGGAPAGMRVTPLPDLAKEYVGTTDDGKLAHPVLRDKVAQQLMDDLAFQLTVRRNAEESRSTTAPSFASSMFKYYGTEQNKKRQELMLEARGTQMLGWEGEGFTPGEITACRTWLRSKGNSIEGGTSEVQLNVIAKRVLGLPD